MYFCAADAVLIAQILYYTRVNPPKSSLQTSNQVDVEDRPDQPLLSRRPSDIGLPGSRRRSSVSQKRRGAATLPLIAEDDVHVYPWPKNFLSVFAVCALGALVRTSPAHCVFVQADREPRLGSPMLPVTA